MIQYMDMTNTEGCIGILPENGETIVFTGVSVSSMPLSVKRREGALYEDFARKYGIQFIFDDAIPEIDFYAVPWLNIGATDQKGGFIASVGEPFSLSDAVRLVYISPDRRCWLITDDGREFLRVVSDWRNRLSPFDGVKLYAGKDTAKAVYDIIDIEKTDAYQKLMKMVKK